jgi:hypothetical protein
MLEWKEAAYGDYILRVITDQDSSRTNYSIILLGARDPRAQRSAQLVILAHQPSATKVLIEDLCGSGHYSGHKGEGIGTLLTNALITILQSRLIGTTKVIGELTHAGDPDEDELRAKCKQDREHFWERFGFKVVPGTRNDRIEADLQDLQVVGGKPVFGVVPRCLDQSNLSIINRNDFGGDWFRMKP